MQADVISLADLISILFKHKKKAISLFIILVILSAIFLIFHQQKYQVSQTFIAPHYNNVNNSNNTDTKTLLPLLTQQLSSSELAKTMVLPSLVENASNVLFHDMHVAGSANNTTPLYVQLTVKLRKSQIKSAVHLFNQVIKQIDGLQQPAIAKILNNWKSEQALLNKQRLFYIRQINAAGHNTKNSLDYHLIASSYAAVLSKIQTTLNQLQLKQQSLTTNNQALSTLVVEKTGLSRSILACLLILVSLILSGVIVIAIALIADSLRTSK